MSASAPRTSTSAVPSAPLWSWRRGFRPIVSSAVSTVWRPSRPTRPARCCRCWPQACPLRHSTPAACTADAWSSVRQLATQWRTWRPDVVQTFLFHANILGRLAAFRAGVPHVASGIRVAERRSGWRLWIDRATDRLVERHVCVSQAVADFSRTRGRLPAPKLFVIPNGIDVSQHDSATATSSPRPTWVWRRTTHNCLRRSAGSAERPRLAAPRRRRVGLRPLPSTTW